jgi:hypothetical protein
MSSHREAPEFAYDPVAVSSDVYAFVSPDAPDTVTIIANYIPLEGPDGGPNFFEFGDDVLYAIHIDNDGDARADVTYEFRFTTGSPAAAASFFLYNTGPITSLPSAAWSRPQTFSLTEVRNGSSTVLGANLLVPPCNIGPLSTPNYTNLVSQALAYNSKTTGLNVFAGQRAEGFYVDLGALFDLGDLRPFEAAHVGSTLTAMPGINSTDMLNVHSLAIQVPITSLTRTGRTPTGVADPDAAIGVWTTAQRQKMRGIDDVTGLHFHVGPFRQVSRLGNPLINEVIIPLAKKDFWNSQPPSRDAQFEEFVTRPGLATLLPSLYPGVFPNLAAYTKPRTDLAAILTTGIPGGIVPNYQTFTGTTQADLLRLNMAIAPATTPSCLGLLGGDLAGYPNGRRVFDDVATIELRCIAGASIPLVDPTFTPDGVIQAAPGSGGLQFGLITGPQDLMANHTENYLSTFPYLNTPHSGYNAHTPAALTG